LLDVDVLAEEVKPRAGAMSVSGAPEAVTDRLETFFGEVAGNVEDVEELDELGEGISTGKIKRRKSGTVSSVFPGDAKQTASICFVMRHTYTILKLARCRRQRALGSRYQRPSG
jgi:hypothetical protein